MGVDVSHLTLVNQQVVALGESVNLGIVDADRARALFFVDAPLGMTVTALKPQEPDPRKPSSRTFSSSWARRRKGRPTIEAGLPRRNIATAARKAMSRARSSALPSRQPGPAVSGCETRGAPSGFRPSSQTSSTFTLRRSRSLRAWCQMRSITAFGLSTPGQVMDRQLLLARLDHHRSEIEQAGHQSLLLDINVLNAKQLHLVSTPPEEPGIHEEPSIGQFVTMPLAGKQDLPAKGQPVHSTAAPPSQTSQVHAPRPVLGSPWEK